MKNKIFIILAITLAFSACKKQPGPGGRASIKGKVWVKEYNNEFTILKSEHYAQGENVYITYGDNPEIKDKTETSYDGSFEFPYLQKGKYKIFVVSKDSTTAELSGQTSVIREVEITAKKQTVIVEDITIIN